MNRLLDERDIPTIARAVVDEIKERGAAMQALDQRAKERDVEFVALRRTLWERLEQTQQQAEVIRQRDVRIAALERLVNELRCGDLVPFQDDDLPPERADAFRAHLATCTTCQAGLQDLVQLDARLSTLARPR